MQLTTILPRLARRFAPVAFIMAILVMALLAPSSALAAFKRPFVRQLDNVPSGTLVPQAAAVDGAGDLWVANVIHTEGSYTEQVSEFDSAGQFLKALDIDAEHGIAINRETGDIYVATDREQAEGEIDIYDSSGTLLNRVGPLAGEPTAIGIDNSNNILDPGAGDVYVTVTNGGGSGIQRFTASGTPAPFEASGSVKYISGNEITGGPAYELPFGGFGGPGSPKNVAVNSEGDIYVVVPDYKVGNEDGLVVLEYAPNGTFLSAITGKGTPGVGSSHEENGWGALIEGLAVDPVSGHVLVYLAHLRTVEGRSGREGAVDEFEPSGNFVAQVNQTAEGQPLYAGNGGENGKLAAGPDGEVYFLVQEAVNLATGAVEYMVDEYGAGHYVPSIRLGNPSERKQTSAVLNGKVDPEDLSLTECQFEYVGEAAFRANDVNEVQTVTLAGATGGTYDLTLDGQSTAATGTGDLVGPASGTGNLIEGSNTITGVAAATNEFAVGEQIAGVGIPAETRIRAVDTGTIVLTADATASGSGVALSAVSDRITGVNTTSGAFASGQQVSGDGIPAGTTIVEAAGGTLRLSADLTASGSAVALSSALAYDATAAQVQSALEGLSTVGAGAVAVSGESGGPYTIEFTGPLAHVDVAQMSASASGLTPAGATVTPAVSTRGGNGWGTAITASCEAPSAAEVPVDAEYHAVHASVAGLREGTVYHYRLSAASTGKLGGAETSTGLAFTTPAPASVQASQVENLTSRFAELHAQIDPLGADTTYQFQYVDAAGYRPEAEDPYAGGATVPANAADIGTGGATGSVVANVAQQIGGLTPNSTYHFRVVATNEVLEKGEVVYGPATTYGPDETFTTLPEAKVGLPDGRAYELVTPADKGDAVDMFSAREEPGQFIDQENGFASPSGNQFLLSQTLSAFGPFPASEKNAYLFTRTSKGWTYKSLASPSFGLQSLDVGAFDPTDFSQVAINAQIGSDASLEGHRITSLVGSPGGPYSVIHADTPVHVESEDEEETTIVGASQDLSDVVLETKGSSVCPGVVGLDKGSHVLCNYFDGELTLLDVGSNGKLLSRCGAVLGQGHMPGAAHNAVSPDGSKVFFTAPDPYAAGDGPGCWNGGTGDTPQIYMRTDGTTTEISAAEKGAPEEAGRYPAFYVGASENDTRIYFLSDGELTKDAAGIHDRELYEYNTETGKLTRVSRGESGTAAAEVDTIPAVAADGTAVYFTAFDALARGATAHEDVGSGAPVNLYRYDTESGATTYIATVTAKDYPDDALEQWGGFGQVALTPSASWYTTPDGRYLLFATSNELTGYSTAVGPTGDCPSLSGEAPSGHCYEVYRYDSASGELACLSCNSSGAPPVSNALFGRSAESLVRSAGPGRAMSDDGSYAFFDTADALVPGDSNGTLDVYEWHDGTISLVSSGKDPAPSFFLGTSATGADVFIGTHANLVPGEETASKGNIYDAHLCSAAAPCIEPPAGETAQCEGGACLNPPPSPTDATPTSLTFSGAGNLTAEAGGQSHGSGKAEPLSRAQKLKKALKACLREPKKDRAACRKRAQKRYGTKSTKSNRKGKH
jgi:hypothetical protein